MTPKVHHLNLRSPDGSPTVLGAALVGTILGAFLGAALCAVVFTAAAFADRDSDTEWVDLPDGRSVLCVTDPSRGGVDCDWAQAGLEGEPADG